MKRINLLLFIGIALCLNISRATAQKNIYFIDYAEVPPEIGYRTGFIVTLQNDTIYGRLRNTESVGSILTPREISTKHLTIVLKNGGRLPKIAFIPESAPKSEQQKYTPNQIKAFGYLASYFEQQPVELEASYSKSGFITQKALKRVLSLRDPYEDIHLLQRSIYNGFADFESWYIEGAKESRFLQRIAEGKMNLYYDTERNVYYVTKADAPRQLISVNYDDQAFLERTFGDSKQVTTILQAASEMRRAENFVSR